PKLSESMRCSEHASVSPAGATGLTWTVTCQVTSTWMVIRKVLQCWVPLRQRAAMEFRLPVNGGCLRNGQIGVHGALFGLWPQMGYCLVVGINVPLSDRVAAGYYRCCSKHALEKGGPTRGTPPSRQEASHG